jgi:fibronectin-binding autotransporter adhesin
MVAIHWKSDVGGDFALASNWNKGAVPGATDDAILDAAGATAYTVTSSTSETVHSIQTLTTATLSITGGTFSASAGTGTGGNAGTIMVGDATVFDVGGSLANTGLIAIDSAGDTTEMFLTANTTLSGGGHLTLSDSAANYIFATATTTTLNNVNNTISGAGQIGDGQMTLINQKAGVIDATGANALTLNTGASTLTNAGLIEATGSGGLGFGSETVNDSTGGTITAGAGSFVNIQNADIIGGVLQSTGTGIVQMTGSATLDAATAAMTLSGTLSIADAATLTIKGALTNNGTISSNSAGDATEIRLSANTTLSGGGQVTLSDNPANLMFGDAAADTLVNVNNTISGAGDIGDGQMILKNELAGVINAVGANALVINLGNQALTNAGLLEGTGAGGLIIDAAIVDNTTGSIKANANSAIAIENSTVQNAGGGGIVVANGALGTLQGADIVGGAVQVQGTGAFQAVGAASLLDGTKSAIRLIGPLSINDAATLDLAGSIVNSGSISLNSAGDATELTINANTTLSGGGQVTMGDNPANLLFGATSANTLTNVDNTISGAGQLGDGQLTLVNDAAGVINAVGSNALVLNTSSQTVTNAGLIEASGTGGLTIESTVLTNTGATLRANTGAVVRLQGVDVIAGSLTAAGTGVFQITSSAEFDGTGSTVNLTGSFVVDDATTLQLAGGIANNGTIALDSAGDATELLMEANTTLSGGGQVTLSDSAANYVFAAAASNSLVNVNNTIDGAGQLGDGQLTLTNQAAGVINAVGANALVINTSSQVVTNLGLIEATCAGGLTITNTTVNNAGGTIRANTGSLVTLQGADILGGLLAVQGTGGFATSGSAELDGRTSTVTLAGPLLVADANVLTLAGVIANTGTISLHSSGDTTELLLAANTTLSGGGQITLTDSSANSIFGAVAADSLSNVDNTISGAGNLGSGQLTLLNQKAGILNGNGANALIIDTGANTVTNAGLIESTGSGGVRINSPITNSGTLLAHTAMLTVVGPLTNVSGTTLTGGTYEADAGATLELPQNTSIVTDKASIILNGTGSTIEALNTTSSLEVAIDSTLTTVAASGVLDLLGGRNWTTKAAMSNAGTLQLGGGKFAAKSLSNTGTTTGFGTITAPITNSGVLSAQTNKTLSLQGGGLTNVSGTTLTGGTYVVGAGATLQLQDNVSVVTLAATVDLAGAVAILQSLNTTTSTQFTLESSLTTIASTGILQVLGGRAYTTANAIGNAGALQLGGGTFTSGTLTNAAGSSLTGFGTVASTVSEAGTVTASGGALAFSGTGDTFSTALAGTEIDFTGGTDLLQSTASLAAAKIGISGGATVTLATAQTYGGVLNLGAGTIALGGSSLTLTGTGSLLAGAVTGGGSLILSGGSDTFNTGAGLDAATTLSMTNTVAVTVGGAASLAGPFSAAAGTSLTLNKGAVLTLTGATTFGASIAGAGTLALGGTATMTLTGSLADGAILAQGAGTTIAVGANTLTLSGTGSTMAGSVIGTGTLVDSGGTQALNAGANLSIANWSVTGGATTVNANLTYAGAFSESAGATLSVATGDKLTLSKASTLGGTVNGAGTLAVANATLNGLTVGGTTVLSITGTALQTGAVTIGDATSNKATLSIAKGATYTVSGAVGIAHGHSAKSSLKVIGTLIKSGATGASTIDLATSDTGLIEAAAGTLDFSNKLAGTGMLKIDSAAVLEADSSAASSLTAVFNGANATLALKTASKFAATISGYGVGDTVDLLGKKATSASINGSDQLVIVNGATTVATLQLSGTYSGATFSVGSDGNGGTSVEMLATSRVPPAFIAAMASLGGGAGAALWHVPVGGTATGLQNGLVVTQTPGRHTVLA